MNKLINSTNNQETVAEHAEEDMSPKHKINSVTLIYVPIYCGGKHRGASIGPAAVRAANIKEKIESLGLTIAKIVEIDTPDSLCWKPEKTKEPKCVPEIIQISNDIARAIEAAMEAKTIPVTIGGDHSLSIGTISGAANYYRKAKKNFGLIWFDAHGDINTPETSTTGAVHGMPLAAVLGKGEKGLTEIGGPAPKLTGKRSVLVGIRDLDPPEWGLIKELGVKPFTMLDINRLGINRVMDLTLQSIGTDVDGIHVSFDIDVIDPQDAPGVTTASRGGISYREACLALSLLAESGLVKSIDFAELNPARDIQNKTTELTVELVKTILGERGL